jgi:hypothetical protein
MVGDDQFLDLRGALVDPERAGLPVETFHDRAFDQAYAPMDLHRLINATEKKRLKEREAGRRVP